MTNKSKVKRSKISKNKTSKNKQGNVIWDIYGRVLNPKTKKYIRIGSSESMKVISELEKNNEWKKRVNYIVTHHKCFGEKLKKYLERKGINV